MWSAQVLTIPPPLENVFTPVEYLHADVVEEIPGSIQQLMTQCTSECSFL